MSLIESGKRTPTPDVLRLLARKLGCSPAYLSSGIDEATQERMRTTLQYAEIALQNGEAAEARDHFRELLADRELPGLPELGRQARMGYALALEACGALEEALEQFTALAGTLSPDYDTQQWIELHIAIVRCHRERGDLATSAAVGERAFAGATEQNRPWTDETVKLGATLVGAYLERGDLVSARQLTERLVERAEALGTPVARMAAYWHAAIAAKHQADFESAVSFGERALANLGEAADQRNLSRLRCEYGALLLLARPQDARHAHAELERAMSELTASSAGKIDIAWCLVELARAELAMDQPERAVERAAQAGDLLGDEPRLATASALIVRAEAQFRLDRQKEAQESLSRAMDVLSRMEPSREAAQGWFKLADLLAEAGSDQQQADAYRRALACAGL